MNNDFSRLTIFYAALYFTTQSTVRFAVLIVLYKHA